LIHHVEWRYLVKGRVIHAINDDEVKSWMRAWCGARPPLGDDWRGTGNQAEYERAALLPCCKLCLDYIARNRLPPQLKP
jgi:hypothetical protein